MRHLVRVAKFIAAAWLILALMSAGFAFYLWNGQRSDRLTYEQCLAALDAGTNVPAASQQATLYVVRIIERLRSHADAGLAGVAEFCANDLRRIEEAACPSPSPRRPR